TESCERTGQRNDVHVAPATNAGDRRCIDYFGGRTTVCDAASVDPGNYDDLCFADPTDGAERADCLPQWRAPINPAGRIVRIAGGSAPRTAGACDRDGVEFGWDCNGSGDWPT